MTYAVPLPRLGTFDAWRDAARRLASHGVNGSQIEWRMAGDAPSLFDEAAALPPPTEFPLNVPRDFPALARQVCASRTAGAFSLLYDLLIRVADRPKLLTNRADPSVQRAEEIAKNIRRDMHKMKAFLRFREVGSAGSERRRFVSWFEPDHRIEENIAGFFTRRFADMDWAIITPEVTTRFENGTLSQIAQHSERPDLSDETEELWRTYYANIFNPARLKIKAMQAEMPKKYWKNLPEADLIPGLIAQAEARTLAMAAAAPSIAPVGAARITQRLHDTQVETAPVRDALQSCTRCPLAATATQAVAGEGPALAALMIVGEQPGDFEDLAGRPFVGPAGQAFDALAIEAGLDRSAAYVTNAVKHFKFQPRGKRRIHQSPNASEVQHCRWWLTREIAEVQPALMLALGATAALALTGDGSKITARRGTVERGLDGRPVLITYHPAFLLRQQGDAERTKQTALMRADLALAAEMLAQIESI
ncbi:DNA polymerase [Sulfitobacter brevis]|uniref:Type-4 uracil-DNA glycosylase n=1 Tax=Sulfitobacter brevis TaxID=74348 RepID=A0A1I1SYA1_9RHOB|nr:UdgX family uracil-DNA binding protein [Sulfitobacter brevis]SFD49748.1 DNA polymerase [Sulfitobacter brevis]